MGSNPFVLLGYASGMLEAEILRSMFNAHGIQVWLSRESVGLIYGIGVGPVGEVAIYVLEEQAELAQELWRDYQTGSLASEN